MEIFWEIKEKVVVVYLFSYIFIYFSNEKNKIVFLEILKEKKYELLEIVKENFSTRGK